MSFVSDHRTRSFCIAIEFGVVVLVSGLCVGSAEAGMPTVLPSGWTAAETPGDVNSPEFLSSGAAVVRIQAISFFVALFLLGAWAVKSLWNLARSDFPQLPILSFGRSLGLLTLWGLVFVIVLTMISGARELMTPGAWRKQGWTYRLADHVLDDAASRRDARRLGLEALRTAMWQFAATHDGRLPDPDEPSIDQNLWHIPGWPGLHFVTVRDRSAEAAGRIHVFEPDSEGDERLVLLTNGFIGTMRSAEISQLLALEQTTAPSAQGAEQ